MIREEDIQKAKDATFPIPEGGRSYEQSLVASGFELGARWASALNEPNISFKELMIRSCIEIALTDVIEKRFSDYGTSLKECLEWIEEQQNKIAFYEKQGEQKVPVVDFNAKNWYVSKVDGKIHDMTYNPTDKVEPKFKIGDYIVSDYCMGRVVEITSDAYLLDIGQGIPFSCKDNVHLWTIQDAKDGDVLVDKYGNIGIYQGDKNAVVWYSCCYCGVNKVFYTEGSHEFPCYPATKEQRDLLFQKMKEAGYELYDEKKKLKKIEPQPAWSDEDDYNLQCMIAKVTFDIQKGNVGRNNELMDWLKSLKERVQPKQEWSEEDENVLEDIKEAIINYWHGDTQDILLDWIKSLKDKIRKKIN